MKSTRCVLVLLLASLSALCQSFNATVSGTVVDPSGLVVPGAALTLTSAATGVKANFATGDDGIFRFPSLQRGEYELRVAASGFKEFVQKRILINLNDSLRIDVRLEVGTATQSVEVTAQGLGVNVETAEARHSINPDSMMSLPLLVAGNQRAAASFIVLMPGVSTGGGASPLAARINGGVQSGEEAVLDGISMQQGAMSQGEWSQCIRTIP